MLICIFRFLSLHSSYFYMNRKDIRRFLLIFYSCHHLYFSLSHLSARGWCSTLQSAVSFTSVQLPENEIQRRYQVFFQLIMLRIVLYGSYSELWCRMTCSGKTSENSMGMSDCQELHLGWKQTVLNCCLVHSRSSHCNFLKAGKLAVDRGWAINVGKYKCSTLNDTWNNVFKII